MGLLDFFSGGAEEPEMMSGAEMARETVGAQEVFLPERERLREQYGSQIMQGALGRAGTARSGLSGIAAGQAQDISRDRGILNRGDMDMLRQQSQGFTGAERLQALLQQQAEDELALGGQLSNEEMRNVDQLTQQATQRQGRGAGAFNVGQLALGRQGAVDARKAQRRQFAGQTIGSGLAVSNPLQRIMQQNTAAAGSLPQRLGQTLQFADQNTVNFDPINQNVANAAQAQFAADQAQYQADKSFLPDLIGGGLSMAGSIFGGPAGGMLANKIFGGGGGGAFPQGPVTQTAPGVTRFGRLD